MTLKENNAFLTVLGVFIGIVAANSLQNILSLPDLIWLFSSFLILFLSISFIYRMVIQKEEEKNPWWVEALRISSVFIFGFLPFSLQKMFLNFNEKITPSFWGPWCFIFHLIVVIWLYLAWEIAKNEELEKRKGNGWRIILGIIITIFIILVGGILDASNIF